MRSSERIAIKIALILLAVGAVTAFAAAEVVGFDFSELVQSGYEPHGYYMSGDGIDSISVDAYDCDIRFAASDDGMCQVVCPENNKITHTVEVNDGTLEIKRVDNRKWYERIGFFINIIGPKEIIVYLPGSTYESLRAASVSGDITIPAGFSFASAALSSTSGDIKCNAAVNGSVSVATVSGDIEISCGDCENMNVASTSGDITVTDAALSGEFRAKAISGNVTLQFVTASDSINIETVSGNVRLGVVDAETLDIVTTSGNVTGTIKTGKTFTTDTVSGRIDVPVSASGGKCKIKTTSGNIKIGIASAE